MPGEGAPVGEGKRITLSSPIAHHHHHHNVFWVLSVWCFGVSSVYSFDLLYSLLFGHITVITITHVMRMTHMHHHSSWFLVCETIRERRRRHHRDHGWPQAADTPSSFFRTSHPPNYTDATQHAAIPGGPRSRYSGPNERRSADGQTPGTGTLRMGFAQLTTSRSRLARTRHHRRQSSVTSEFGDVTEFRCPGPTPSDAASPVCPSRHHAAGYGQLPPGLQRVQQDFHPITMCTSHHHIITYYIARTD